MALTQAQARQSQIDQLGSIGSNRADYDSANVMSAAEGDVAAFIERVQQNINVSGMVITGKIEQMSIAVTTDSIQILGNDYLLYQDRGVRGSESGALAPNSPHKYSDKMPPLQIFVDYIKQKNLNLRDQGQFFEGESHFKDLTEEEKILKVAKAIQIHVFKFGFKPRDVFAKEIPQLREDLKRSIQGFGADAIKEVFRFKR